MNARQVSKGGLVGICMILALLFLSSVEGAGESSNLKIELLKDYSAASPGETVWFTLKFFNFANTARMDVVMQYSVVDEAGVVQLSKSETVAVETQASFVRSYPIPSDASEGEYKLHAVVRYATGDEAVADESFFVKTPEVVRMVYVVGGIVIAVIVVLLIAFSGRIGAEIERSRMRLKVHRIVSRVLSKKK